MVSTPVRIGVRRRVPGARTTVRRLPAGVLLPGLVLAVVALAAFSLATGSLGIPLREVVGVLGDRIGLVEYDATQAYETIVLDVRLPRVLMAVLVGAGLGMSGATLQGVFRNPLADPGLIGVSSGAALGAVAAIVLGIGSFGGYTTPVLAFAGALLVTMTVYRIARHGGRTEVVTIILTGIAINAIVASGIGYLTFVATDQQLRSIVFWQLGSFANAKWDVLVPAAVLVGAGVAYLPRLARALDLLALGEREARHLGVATERLRLQAVAVSALVVGASVSVAGIIGFVGLVAPHLVRILCGPRHATVLAGSALFGALLLLGADLFARTAVDPKELPLGVVTSAIGGLFFLWLLVVTRREQGGWG